MVRLSFQGHRKDRAAYEAVTFDDWLAEFGDGVCLAKRLSCNGPVSFLGFSLGSLVATHFLSRFPETFESQVHLAPALAPRPFTQVLKALSWFPTFPVPSLSTPEFRAESSTPIAAYNATFDAEAKLDQITVPRSIPTLVWMDPRDELVDLKTMESWAARKELTWSFRQISTLAQGRLSHHLMVTAQNFLPEDWTRLVSTSEEWFLSHARVRSAPQECVKGAEP